MITNFMTLLVNMFLFGICFLQVWANFIVCYVWMRSRKLKNNDNLILLVSLAIIDFVYAVLQCPYLIILISGWVPDGQIFHFDGNLIIWVGGPSAALMKSGCTVTTAIAADRLIALYFPVSYYKRSKRIWCWCAFAFSILMALVDFMVMVATVPIRDVYNCASFGCFVTEQFRMYWGFSNVFMNSLSCLLTLVIIYHLYRRKPQNAYVEKENRNKIDKSANRVALYILIVSAVFGVVPGCINSVGELFDLKLLNEISFFVGTCASISGLSHAFIFAMAHRDIRSAIARTLCGSAVISQKASPISVVSTNNPRRLTVATSG